MWDQTFNTDETWIFVRGGWGEPRLGDEDGATDRSGGLASSAVTSWD